MFGTVVSSFVKLRRRTSSSSEWARRSILHSCYNEDTELRQVAKAITLAFRASFWNIRTQRHESGRCRLADLIEDIAADAILAEKLDVLT